MMRTARFIALLLFPLLLAACGDGTGCYRLQCDANDQSCRQTLPRLEYRPVGGGDTQRLGIISYVVVAVKDVVNNSASIVFNKIVTDRDFQNLVTAVMTLFVAVYGIAIALGLAQPSPLDLVVRAAKLAAVYFLLTSWGNFYEVVVTFFESLTNGLTNIMTSAIISSASGTANARVTGMDVFGFIDERVLGTLLSVRFAVIIGAMFTISPVGLVIGLLLLSVVLSYLGTLISAVQIYIMAFIARSLLYAVSPIFLIFLMFQQTKSLFDGWLKQLINFSLQPVLLVAFMAFFNGIFFNYMENMFRPGYSVCYQEEPATSGQTVRFHGMKIMTNEGAISGHGRPIKQLTEVMDVFTLFVVIMLGFIMIKMNGWAVQAAAQLSEGGISFSNSTQAMAQFAQASTRAMGDALRSATNIKPGGKK